MGCGCGQMPRAWEPVQQGEQAPADEAQGDPNERIQQQRHEAAAARVWPATWNGGRAPAATR